MGRICRNGIFGHRTQTTRVAILTDYPYPQKVCQHGRGDGRQQPHRIEAVEDRPVWVSELRGHKETGDLRRVDMGLSV